MDTKTPIFTIEDFQPLVGTLFSAPVGGGESIALRLVEVHNLGRRPAVLLARPGAREFAFSLYFEGPAQPILPQQTGLLEHEQMGEVTLFLVPLGPGPDGAMRYEAIFN